MKNDKIAGNVLRLMARENLRLEAEGKEPWTPHSLSVAATGNPKSSLIRDLVRGKTNSLRADNADSLARLLNCTIAEIVEGEPDPIDMEYRRAWAAATPEERRAAAALLKTLRDSR